MLTFSNCIKHARSRDVWKTGKQSLWDGNYSFPQVLLDAATKGFTSVDKIGNFKIVYMNIFPTQFSLSQAYTKDNRQLVSVPQWDERRHCCPSIRWGLWESEQADRVLLLLIQSWQGDHCWRLRYLKSVTVCNWPLENKSKFPQEEEWELIRCSVNQHTLHALSCFLLRLAGLPWKQRPLLCGWNVLWKWQSLIYIFGFPWITRLFHYLPVLSWMLQAPHPVPNKECRSP